MNNLLFTMCLLLTMFLLSAFVGRFSVFYKRTFDCSPFSQDTALVIKGFSIIIILTSHIGNKFGVRYLTPLGAWGVALFLFFSGFGLMKSEEKRGLKEYWVKRFKTAFLPYALVELFGIVFIYEDIGWLGAVKGLLLIEPLHPLGWYMQCLFLYYIAFYFSALAGRKMQRLRVPVLVTAALLMFLCMRSLFKQQVFSFVFGVLAARYEERIAVWVRKIWVALVFGFLGVVFLALRQVPVVRFGPQLFYCSIEALQVVSLMIATIAVFAVLFLRVPPYVFWGMYASGIISFEIYLTHIFLMPEVISAFHIACYYLQAFLLAGFLHRIKSVFTKSGVDIKR